MGFGIIDQEKKMTHFLFRVEQIELKRLWKAKKRKEKKKYFAVFLLYIFMHSQILSYRDKEHYRE